MLTGIQRKIVNAKDRQETTKEKKKAIRTVLKRERYESLFCVHMKSYERLSYQMG